MVGGMRANTETSRSSARARAATTMSISRQEKETEILGGLSLNKLVLIADVDFSYNFIT